jgi:hypothetical protein
VWTQNLVRVAKHSLFHAQLMQERVTCDAQCNQILFRVIAALATKFLVMELQVLPGAADLASPAIAMQHVFEELIVQLGIKPQARALGSNPVHDVFSATSCRKA